MWPIYFIHMNSFNSHKNATTLFPFHFTYLFCLFNCEVSQAILRALGLILTNIIYCFSDYLQKNLFLFFHVLVLFFFFSCAARQGLYHWVNISSPRPYFYPEKLNKKVSFLLYLITLSIIIWKQSSLSLSSPNLSTLREILFF